MVKFTIKITINLVNVVKFTMKGIVKNGMRFNQNCKIYCKKYYEFTIGITLNLVKK